MPRRTYPEVWIIVNLAAERLRLLAVPAQGRLLIAPQVTNLPHMAAEPQPECWSSTAYRDSFASLTFALSSFFWIFATSA